MNDSQTTIILKITQFIIDGLSLFIMINLFRLKYFIKIKPLFGIYIINILLSISFSFWFYNNVEMNKLFSIICFASSLCIFTIYVIKAVQLDCSSG